MSNEGENVVMNRCFLHRGDRLLLPASPLPFLAAAVDAFEGDLAGDFTGDVVTVFAFDDFMA